jgi:putative transposase
MRHSYVSNHVHFVFSTKRREKNLTPEIQNRLWQYIGGIAKEKGILPVAIGGYDDHCHALLTLQSPMAVSKAAQYIKGGSSIWLSETFPELQNFRWQKGYGAFSVSVSHIPATVAYIHNQAEHHKKQSFEDEYFAILRKHEIAFDPKMIFNEEDD